MSNLTLAKNGKYDLYYAIKAYKLGFQKQAAFETILRVKQNLLEHIIYKNYNCYGMQELTCKGYTEEEMFAVAVEGVGEALEHFDLQKAEEKAKSATHLERMFTSFCHQYAEARVKREIGSINGMTEHYMKMFIRTKTAGVDINQDSQELLEVFSDFLEPNKIIATLGLLIRVHCSPIF